MPQAARAAKGLDQTLSSSWLRHDTSMESLIKIMDLSSSATVQTKSVNIPSWVSQLNETKDESDFFNGVIYIFLLEQGLVYSCDK